MEELEPHVLVILHSPLSKSTSHPSLPCPVSGKADFWDCFTKLPWFEIGFGHREALTGHQGIGDTRMCTLLCMLLQQLLFFCGHTSCQAAPPPGCSSDQAPGPCLHARSSRWGVAMTPHRYQFLGASFFLLRSPHLPIPYKLFFIKL